MEAARGTRVAQYLIERKLGDGGMGDVYLARDTRLDRSVAIKFLTRSTDPQSRRRLLREARAVAGLDHPGICAVYEVATDATAGDFIAMQYIEGETLAMRLRRGRMRPDEALVTGGLIADALMAAHRRGLVHRDLKPGNIIITPSGAPKLLDFGLARHAPNTPAAANAATTSQVTDPDVVAGTPAYMAPEQVRNEPPDVRSDVFSLGAVLYECLTGTRAFQGATTAETLGNVLHVDPPRVSSVVAEAGPTHDALCARLLHKNPDERFQSVEEVLGAIRTLTPSSRLPSPVPSARAGRLTSRRVALVAVAGLIAVALYQFWPRGPALPVAPPEAARYYAVGVEAMHAGTFATARAAFLEAIRVFADYPQAYSRLAEAQIGLDDERGASAALLQVSRLVPDRSRLDAEDRLRFEAASASALRQHDAAIGAYRQLAGLRTGDAGRWLDVGRAEEAAARLPAAREAYAQAVAADPQSAAAHLRLGILQARARQTAEGLASIDEAIRLYQAVTNAEGEAEALLARGRALRGVGRAAEARASLEDVLRRAGDPRFAAQRVSAQVELALIDYVGGKFASAEALAARAVEEARTADLPTVAARGLISLGVALIGPDPSGADAHLAQAVDLARVHGATRIEHRARLQQASLRLRTSQPAEALTLAEATSTYFTQAGETRNALDVKLIQARAYEDLDRMTDAMTINAEIVTIATDTKDNVLLANVLENLAGQLTKLGRWPDALAHRERLEDLHRTTLKDQSAVPKDMTQRAELLVLLGRLRDAETVLASLDERIATGDEAYLPQRPSILLIRALAATIEQRWTDARRSIAALRSLMPARSPGAPPGYREQFSRVLDEFALAHLGRSQVAASALATWPQDATLTPDRREFSYWVARTLLVRGEPAMAGEVARAALADAAADDNLELSWRLRAVAAGAAGQRDRASATRLAGEANSRLDQIRAAWGQATDAYLARPDIATLVKGVQ